MSELDVCERLSKWSATGKNGWREGRGVEIFCKFMFRSDRLSDTVMLEFFHLFNLRTNPKLHRSFLLRMARPAGLRLLSVGSAAQNSIGCNTAAQ